MRKACQTAVFGYNRASSIHAKDGSVPLSPKLHRTVLRFCFVLLLLLIGNLIRTVWQQKASINLAIAKGQQLYMSPDGQPLALDAAALANLNTADSNLVFVDALPMTLAESRPWAEMGCTAITTRTTPC